MVESGKSGVTLSVKRQTRYVFKYAARLTIKNTGAKAVKAVEWSTSSSSAKAVAS